MKIYVDTNIVSGLAKKDFNIEIINYFYKILEYRKNGIIDLYVSELTANELKKIPEEFKYHHNVIYLLLNNISIKPKKYHNLITHGLGGSSGSLITHGLLGTNDPILHKIEEIIPQKNNLIKKEGRQKDIEHLFQCYKNNLDIFWTEDVKTILNYHLELKQIGLHVLNSENLYHLIAKKQTMEE